MRVREFILKATATVAIAVFCYPLHASVSLVGDLPEMHVNSIAQDGRGYIWIGTDNGLFRYNGSQFQTFYHRNEELGTLPSNRVLSLACDSSGCLFAATDAGICLFDETSGSIVTVDRNMTDGRLFHSQGGIVCCGGGGIKLYDCKTHTVSFSKKSGLHDIEVFASGEDGTFWGGSTDGSIMIQYSDSFEPTRTIRMPEISPFTSMAKGADKCLWIGTGSGLSIFDGDGFREIPQGLLELIDGNKVNALIPDKECMYICISKKGIVSYDFSSGTITKGIQTQVRVNKLSDVSCGLCDHNGRLWIGTRDRGIGNAYQTRRNFAVSSLFSELTKGKYINCTTSSADGLTIWAGSFFKGILGFDKASKSGIWYDYNEPEKGPWIDAKGVSAIYCDSRDILWYQADGWIYKCTTDKNRILSREAFCKSNGITAFCEDRMGRIWACGQDGLTCWDGDSHVQKCLEGIPISDISKLSCGKMLVCTQEGLLSVDPEKFQSSALSIPPECTKEYIKCAVETIDGALWLGTDSNGVICIKDGIFECFTQDDGLGSNNISSLCEDCLGNVWISTAHGLSVKSPAFSHLVNFSGAELREVQHFTPHSLTTSGDLIICGGNTGTLMFNPAEIMSRLEVVPPDVILSELKINNESVTANCARSPLSTALDDCQALVLPHRDNIFEIVLDVIDFTLGADGKLLYRLSGKRQRGNWAECGSTHSISFFQLPSGSYTLEVKAINPQGFSNGESRAIDIKVKTPFWLTTPMILLYLCLLILSIYGILHFMSRRFEDKMKIETAEKELENEKELNTMKVNFFGNISHELRTYLTLVYSPVNMLSKANTEEERNKLIKLINLNTSKLIELVDQSLALTRIESSTLPLNVSLQSPVELVNFYVSLFESAARKKEIELKSECSIGVGEKIPLDTDKIGKILTNLLSNAIKYTSSGGNVRVNTSLCDSIGPDFSEAAASDKYLVISVSDDGIGMKESEISGIFDRYTRLENAEFFSTGSGIGLHYTSQLVKMHKGAIVARLNPDRGMTFTIAVPTDCNLYKDAMSRSGLEVVNGLQASFVHADDSEDKDDDTLESFKETPSTKILLVEDNQLLREFVKSILCPKYDVYTAADGMEALDLVEDLLPDLVITDVMMPRMDGYELSRNIKERPFLSHIPVIMLTAKTDEKDRLAGYENGTDIYITKPFNPDILLTVIDNMISSRLRLREKLMEGTGNDGKLEIEDSAQLGESDRQFLKKLIQYVDDNLLDGNLDILSLSDCMCIGRSSLFRKLRSITGMTPNAFVNKYRLNKAAKLLESGEFRVSEVYDMVGFKSASYFSKAFRQQFGLTPSEYALSGRKKA